VAKGAYGNPIAGAEPKVLRLQTIQPIVIFDGIIVTAEHERRCMRRKPSMLTNSTVANDPHSAHGPHADLPLRRLWLIPKQRLPVKETTAPYFCDGGASLAR
jgi:hypothetical protein